MDKNELVLIQLDRPRFLWCGHKALKVMSELLGKSITEMGDDFSPDDVEKIMYSMLLKDANQHGETLTLDKVADLLDEVPYSYVIDRMAAAMAAAFDMPKTEGNPPAAAVAGIGEAASKPLQE